MIEHEITLNLKNREFFVFSAMKYVKLHNKPRVLIVIKIFVIKK